MAQYEWNESEIFKYPWQAQSTNQRLIKCLSHTPSVDPMGHLERVDYFFLLFLSLFSCFLTDNIVRLWVCFCFHCAHQNNLCVFTVAGVLSEICTDPRQNKVYPINTLKTHLIWRISCFLSCTLMLTPVLYSAVTHG